MPSVNIQGLGRVNFPDSMSEDQIQQAIERDILPKSAPQAPPLPTDPSQYPEATQTQNFLAGMGKGMTDLARGVGERLGLVSPASIDAARKLDAPLMGTRAGNVGALTGNLVAAVPTAFIPGANTVAGAAAIGGALGALQPTGTGESATQNAALGALFGGAGQKLLSAGGNLARSQFDLATAKGAQQAEQNTIRDATLKAAQDAGYVVPPSQANPTMLNRLAEGFSGKIATAQSAAQKNQSVTDALIRGDLNLADKPATPAALQAVRADAGKAYQVVKQAGTIVPDQQYLQKIGTLGGPDYAAVLKDFPEMANPAISKLSDALSKPEFSANSAVSLIKQLRTDATANFKNRIDPEKLALAQAQDSAAGALEDLIDRTLTAQGKPEAVQQFREARTLIAQTHQAERALNPSTGSFDANVYGRLFDQGKPLSGGARQVGQFANAYPKAAQEISTSMPGVSPLDYAAVGSVSAAAHNPGIMASLLARPAVRAAILSPQYQRMFATPSYGPGLLTRAAPSTLRELENLGVSGLLGPSVYAAQ